MNINQSTTNGLGNGLIGNTAQTVTGRIPGNQDQNTNKPGETASQSFASMLGDAFNNVNNQVLESEQKSLELATGANKDIHGTMIAIQKSDIAVKTLSAFRNKIVSAYQEIYRMQI